MEGYNMCAWLTVGNKKPCEKKYLGDYCKVLLAKIKKIDPFLFPVEYVKKGLKVRLNSAVIVCWFAFHGVSTMR